MSTGDVVCGYVLAGGRSSRMGTDKAELLIGGLTMLERAVATMAAATSDVVVVGGRQRLPSGTRGISDRVTSCGPLGGMVAALEDLERSGRGWAVFLPVDMPLVPGGLLAELAEGWMRPPQARVCFAVVSGQAQPLVSAIHAAALPWLRRALDGGDLKLRPVLERTGEEMSLTGAQGEAAALRRTAVTVTDTGVLVDGRLTRWTASRAEWELRRDWFANLNTPEQMDAARCLLARDAVGL